LGLTRLRAFLRRHRRIALDTSVFIYQLEANPAYVALTDAVFEFVARSGNSAVTSTITMTEILVQPHRSMEEDRADEFYALLTTFPHLEWVPPDLAIADLAARLRATHGLKTPDALQVATATKSGATALITNDNRLAELPELETAVLDELR